MGKTWYRMVWDGLIENRRQNITKSDDEQKKENGLLEGKDWKKGDEKKYILESLTNITWKHGGLIG